MQSPIRLLLFLPMKQGEFSRQLGRLLLIFLLILGILAFNSSRSHAQGMGIAATVNDDIISQWDLTSRLSLVIAMAGLPDVAETRVRLAPQVLRSMVEEKLKLQAAQEQGISVSDARIQVAIRRFEQRGRMREGQMKELLQRLGLDKEVMYHQVRADVAWAQAVSRRFASLARVADEAIDEEIQRVESNKGKPEFLISEIFLAIEAPGQQSQAQALAERLIAELEAGANFPALARNFSQSPTAAVGGDLGWIRLNSLPAEVQQLVARSEPGRVLQAVSARDGIYIIWYRQQRASQGFTVGANQAADPSVALKQLTIPLPEGASPEIQQRQLQLAQSLQGRATSCQAMTDLIPETGASLSGDMGTVRLSQLAPFIRPIARDLPVGVASAPVQAPVGFIILMVCDRQVAEVKELSDEEIRQQVSNQLADQRLEIAARQYLRDLRRSAFIDIRLQ